MPFGLSNAPAAFQCFMNNIFGNLLDICTIVYLDNILIYSDDETMHIGHVCDALQGLQKHNLYAQEDKCSFHQTSATYCCQRDSPWLKIRLSVSWSGWNLR